MQAEKKEKVEGEEETEVDALTVENINDIGEASLIPCSAIAAGVREHKSAASAASLDGFSSRDQVGC